MYRLASWRYEEYRKPGKCGLVARGKMRFGEDDTKPHFSGLVAIYKVPQAGKMRLGGGNTSKPEKRGLVAVCGIPQKCGVVRKYTKPEKCGSVAVYGIPQAG